MKNSSEVTEGLTGVGVLGSADPNTVVGATNTLLNPITNPTTGDGGLLGGPAPAVTSLVNSLGLGPDTSPGEQQAAITAGQAEAEDKKKD